MVPGEKTFESGLEQGRMCERMHSLEQNVGKYGDDMKGVYQELREIRDLIASLDKSNAVLGARNALWGIVGGAVPAVVTLILLLVTGKL